MACVYVPVQNSEEEVRVVLDQLPKEANDMIDILKAEQASLDLWLIIAVGVFRSILNLEHDCLSFWIITFQLLRECTNFLYFGVLISLIKSGERGV